MTETLPAKLAETPISLTDCRLSSPLQHLLLELGDRDEALAVIAARPELREEVRASLPSLERTIIGCGPDVVREALAPLILVHANELQSRPKVALWWHPYFDKLADVPGDALRAAVRAWDGEFFPKPGPLREVALRAARPAYQAVGRARAVVKMKRAA